MFAVVIPIIIGQDTQMNNKITDEAKEIYLLVAVHEPFAYIRANQTERTHHVSPIAS
jgi:hypothetical protein